MAFRTKLDFSDNRQVKQYIETTTVLSGATNFGVPFVTLPSGPNTSTSGETANYSNFFSTFSGNSATTIYNWYYASMAAGEPYLSALTPSNSATTQDVAPVFAPSVTTVIDGNTVVLEYSGVTFDILPVSMVDLGGGNYSGTVETTDLSVLSASTLDFTGRTIWVDVSGITRTNDLIINSSGTIGEFWKRIDSEGRGAWSSITGLTDTIWSADTNQTVVLVDGFGLTGGTPNTVYTNNHFVDYKQDGLTFSNIKNESDTINAASSLSLLTIGDSGILTSGSLIKTGRYCNTIGTLTGPYVANSLNLLTGGGNITQRPNINIAARRNDGEIRFFSGNDVLDLPYMLANMNPTGVTIYRDVYINNLPSADPLATNVNGKIVVSPSDVRLKKNINTINSALEKITQLRGVSFEWTEESEMGTGFTKYGLIAQEVNEILPSIVKQLNNQTDYLTLNYIELIPWIIEALKEISGNTHINYLETQTILAEDNNIDLNFNGTNETAVGGGIRVLNARGEESAELKTDVDGNWVTNNDFKPNSITIPQYTPTSSIDENGTLGNVTRDDNYIYIKTSTGWKRANLESF